MTNPPYPVAVICLSLGLVVSCNSSSNGAVPSSRQSEASAGTPIIVPTSPCRYLHHGEVSTVVGWASQSGVETLAQAGASCSFAPSGDVTEAGAEVTFISQDGFAQALASPDDQSSASGPT